MILATSCYLESNDEIKGDAGCFVVYLGYSAVPIHRPRGTIVHRLIVLENRTEHEACVGALHSLAQVYEASLKPVISTVVQAMLVAVVLRRDDRGTG